MTFRSAILAASSVTALVTGIEPAHANEPADAYQNEIVVTARKREENLQSVPLAISVLSQEAIDRKRIVGPADVANQTPGLTFDVGLVPSDTRVSIRGLQATRGRPNVAILVDGVDTSSENFGVAGGGILANLRLVDVERVEIVKGPQTTLYGRSAFAGAINYISKRPGDTLEVSGSALAGSFGTFEAKGAVGGPLGGGFSARLNGGYYSTDGDYVNPVTGGKLNSAKTYGGAIALQYQDGDSFTAFARLSYSREKYTERAQVLLRSVDEISGAVRTQDGGVLLRSLRTATSPFLYSLTGDVSQSATYRAAIPDISGDPNNGGRAYPGSDIETTRATLSLDKSFGAVSVVWLTGFTKNNGHFNQDFDNTNYSLQANTPNASYSAGNPSALSIFRSQFGWPLPFLPSYGLSAELDTRTDITQLSQELRVAYESDNTKLLLDGLFWYEKSIYRDSSLFWLRQGGNQTLAAFISASQGGQFIPGNPPSFFHLLTPPAVSANPQRITRTTNSLSLAASIEQKITPELTATLEGRFIKDTIDYTGFNFDPTPVNTYGVRNASNNPTQFTTNSLSFNKFTPRIGLSYNNGRGFLAYANFAQGTKPGGVDTTDQNGNVTDGVFRPESVDTFEIGAKFTGDRGRLTVAGSLFYNIYKDQQIGTINNSGPIAISQTDNIGKSTSQGVELEANWVPIDQIFLRASYAYTRARYTDYIPPRCSNVDSADTQTSNCSFNGKTPPFTPEHQINLSARFEQPIGDQAKLWIEADTRFVSKRFMSASNLFWLPAYNQTDLRAGIEFGRVTLDAYVDNVFQNRAPRTGTSSVDYGYFDLSSFNLPRGALVALSPKRAFGVRAGFKF